jgi:hypothetical protein
MTGRTDNHEVREAATTPRVIPAAIAARDTEMPFELLLAQRLISPTRLA